MVALFAIFGHRNAGKTIASDLLEGRRIVEINDLERCAVLVREDDHLQQYPPTLMAVHQERIITESFIL